MAIQYFCDGSSWDGHVGFGVVELRTNQNGYYSFQPKVKGDSTYAEQLGIIKCMELATKTRYKNVVIFTDRSDAEDALAFGANEGKVVFYHADTKETWKNVRNALTRMVRKGYRIAVVRYDETNDNHKAQMKKAHELSREYVAKLPNWKQSKKPISFKVPPAVKYLFKFDGYKIICNGILVSQGSKKIMKSFISVFQQLLLENKEGIAVVPHLVYKSWNLNKVDSDSTKFIFEMIKKGKIVSKGASASPTKKLNVAKKMKNAPEIEPFDPNSKMYEFTFETAGKKVYCNGKLASQSGSFLKSFANVFEAILKKDKTATAAVPKTFYSNCENADLNTANKHVQLVAELFQAGRIVKIGSAASQTPKAKKTTPLPQIELPPMVEDAEDLKTIEVKKENKKFIVYADRQKVAHHKYRIFSVKTAVDNMLAASPNSRIRLDRELYRLYCDDKSFINDNQPTQSAARYLRDLIQKEIIVS